MILVGNIGIVSNRETWNNHELELRDDETDALFDISDATDLNIRVAGVDCQDEIEGDMADGTIYVTSPGIIGWEFTVDQMRDLTPGEYQVGITITFSDETKQALVGTLSVIDGIVD